MALGATPQGDAMSHTRPGSLAARLTLGVRSSAGARWVWIIRPLGPCKTLLSLAGFGGYRVLPLFPLRPGALADARDRGRDRGEDHRGCLETEPAHWWGSVLCHPRLKVDPTDSRPAAAFFEVCVGASWAVSTPTAQSAGSRPSGHGQSAPWRCELEVGQGAAGRVAPEMVADDRAG